MNDSPFFSVIIPTYNRQETICKSIESVLRQRCRDFEVIIVDDGSTDNTQKLVLNFEDNRIHYFKSDNGERGRARNIGIKVSKGKYITFLDSDDILYKNYLSKAKEICEKLNFPEIFRTAFEIKDTKGHILEQTTLRDDTANEALVYGNALACLGVFVKSKIIEDFLFIEDRELAGTEDYELWLRLGSRYTIYSDNTITAAILQHNQRSVVQQDIKQLESRIRLFISYVYSDVSNKNAYNHRKNFFIAMRYSYIALHAAISDKKITAMKYLILGLIQYPKFLLFKRFYVIMYKILLG